MNYGKAEKAATLPQFQPFNLEVLMVPVLEWERNGVTVVFGVLLTFKAIILLLQVGLQYDLWAVGFLPRIASAIGLLLGKDGAMKVQADICSRVISLNKPS